MSSDKELIGVKLDLDEVHKDWTIRASWAGSVRCSLYVDPFFPHTLIPPHNDYSPKLR